MASVKDAYWRGGGDSNPRSGFTPDNCLAGSPDRPLQHLSAPAGEVYPPLVPLATRRVARPPRSPGQATLRRPQDVRQRARSSGLLLPLDLRPGVAQGDRAVEDQP